MSEFDQQDLVEDDVGDIRFGDDFGIGVIIPVVIFEIIVFIN